MWVYPFIYLPHSHFKKKHGLRLAIQPNKSLVGWFVVRLTRRCWTSVSHAFLDCRDDVGGAQNAGMRGILVKTSTLSSVQAFSDTEW